MIADFQFSHRTNWSLADNPIASLLKELQRDHVPLIDLTESNPTRCHLFPPQSILTSLSEANNLCYHPTPQGLLEAREAIRQYYQSKNIDVSVSRIFLTASTSEAYSFLFRLLVNEGEKVLSPQPSYPLFQYLGDLNDVEMRQYPLVYDDGWRIDLAKLREAVEPHTKAIILVNPNNPTGSFVKRRELEVLNLICQEQKISLICDEVFEDYAFKRSDDYVNLANNDQALTFTLRGLSKTLGLPQMKLSWIIVNGPQDLVKTAGDRLEVILDTYLSVNTPIQNALAVWLSLKEEIQLPIRSRIKRNLDFLKEKTDASQYCQLLKVEGGWYAPLRIPSKHSEDEWALEFLKKDHVMIHPGYFFDFQEEAYCVLSLLTDEDTFREGVTRILSRISG